jgi:D-alanyl-D-alanine carboxypeptidase (penicillin-binding protein 5/6)
MSLHKAGIAQTDAGWQGRYWWMLSAVGVIALAGLGTGAWWRHRKLREREAEREAERTPESEAETVETG